MAREASGMYQVGLLGVASDEGVMVRSGAIKAAGGGGQPADIDQAWNELGHLRQHGIAVVLSSMLVVEVGVYAILILIGEVGLSGGLVRPGQDELGTLGAGQGAATRSKSVYRHGLTLPVLRSHHRLARAHMVEIAL